MNFDYGIVLTRSFQTAWRYKSFWIFSIVPVMLSFVGLFFFIAPVFLISEESDLVWLVFAIWLLGLVITLVAGTILGAAGSSSLMLGILRVERGEVSTSFLDLLRDGFQYFWRVLGAFLIIQLSFGLVMAVFFCMYFVLSLITMGLASICLQPIFLLMTPISFLVVALMDAAIMAVIADGLAPWDAVKRALQIVREHVWKFVILSLVIYFVSTVLSGIIITPAMIPAMILPLALESGMDMSWEMFLLVAGVFSCVFFPLMALLSGVTGTFVNAVMGISYLRLASPADSEVVFAEAAPDTPAE